jgi:protein TonB
VFSRLPESNARRERRAAGTAVSIVLHFVVIALAVRATSGRADPAPTVDQVTVIYRPPPIVDAMPSDMPPSSAPGQVSVVPAAPAPPTVRIDFDPSSMPDVAPPADVFARASDFDPTRVAATTGASDGPPNGSNGPPLSRDVVDKEILALPGTSPKYPSMLRSAGVEGDVRAQFVVDTLGRVELGSVRVLSSTHDLFTSAVRDALGRARFTAAEAGGRKVRQLAEQVFTFRISR